MLRVRPSGIQGRMFRWRCSSDCWGGREGLFCPLGLFHLPSQSSCILDLCENIILQPASQSRNQSHLQRLPFPDPPSQHQSTPAASKDGSSWSGGPGDHDSSWLELLQGLAAACTIPQLGILHWAGSQSVIPDGRIWVLVHCSSTWTSHC